MELTQEEEDPEDRQEKSGPKDAAELLSQHMPEATPTLGLSNEPLNKLALTVDNAQILSRSELISGKLDGLLAFVKLCGI